MKNSKAEISKVKTIRRKKSSKKYKSVKSEKKIKQMPTHDSFGNPIRSLAAMKAKYELLDGDAPENRKPLPTKEERDQFFTFAGQGLIEWMQLPHAKKQLDNRTSERVLRQMEFKKLSR